MKLNTVQYTFRQQRFVKFDNFLNFYFQKVCPVNIFLDLKIAGVTEKDFFLALPFIHRMLYVKHKFVSVE